ncbi:MAG: DNA methyltransferase [Candidatus Yanofskybacteria bacterium]|nr:DNA methyltransferase [Candidatus Yanofskybacteria bacterium]
MLTKRQKQIFDYTERFIEEKGYSPTLEDIRKHFRLRSKATIHQHLRALEERGYIGRAENATRGIKIIKEQDMELTPITLSSLSVVDAPTATQEYLPSRKLAELPLNQVILGDALEKMRDLPSNSFDIIIADPPYNIGKNFGNNIDRKELSEYVSWSKDWITESIRLMKPTGTLFIYGFSEILAYLSVEIPINKRWLIWHYTNKNVASLNFWQRSHEAIICAWKDRPIFNRDKVREPYTEGFLNGAAGKKRAGTVGRFSKNGQETVYKAHENGALPRDVLKIPTLAGGAGMSERWFVCKNCNDVCEPRELKKHLGHEIEKHPTQKPLELTRRLMESAMPQKDGLILVPFVGTGSECVVAKTLGHNYIGFELNPDYVKIAQKWLETTIVPKKSTLTFYQVSVSSPQKHVG